MATLYISEYIDVVNLGSLSGGGVVNPQAPQEPAVIEQAIGISGSSTQSSSFTGRFIRVNCDAVCSLLFGSNPTAVTAAKRLAQNQTEFFGVTPGQKLAVIANV